MIAPLHDKMRTYGTVTIRGDDKKYATLTIDLADGSKVRVAVSMYGTKPSIRITSDNGLPADAIIYVDNNEVLRRPQRSRDLFWQNGYRRGVRRPAGPPAKKPVAPIPLPDRRPVVTSTGNGTYTKALGGAGSGSPGTTGQSFYSEKVSKPTTEKPETKKPTKKVLKKAPWVPPISVPRAITAQPVTELFSHRNKTVA
jgi:hypothetical protein